MSTENRNRIAVRMEPETMQRLEQWFRADNCKSKNEFIVKAMNFYIDYLEAQDNKTLYEYEDYLTKPTKVNASAFITLALEANWDSIHESEQYMKYIATRPRAERIGTHGLFGDDDAVSLDKAMEELESYTGNVSTHIISLKREDAARLGFDNAG